jgi:pimeloyl-ACP methyl ester carboxylesterase
LTRNASRCSRRVSGSSVLLLHGSGPGVSAASNWSGVIPALAEHHRVLAFDFFGFGDSEQAAADEYGIKLWQRQLIGVVDALELERVPLVGNSFGGAMALALAIRMPERVSRLVLMGTPVGDYELTDGLRGGRAFDGTRDGLRRVLAREPGSPPAFATFRNSGKRDGIPSCDGFPAKAASRQTSWTLPGPHCRFRTTDRRRQPTVSPRPALPLLELSRHDVAVVHRPVSSSTSPSGQPCIRGRTGVLESRAGRPGMRGRQDARPDVSADALHRQTPTVRSVGGTHAFA